MSESDPTLIVPRRGRPRAKEPGSAVMVWVPRSEHDRLIQIARGCDVSVSAIVRQVLITELPKTK